MTSEIAESELELSFCVVTIGTHLIMCPGCLSGLTLGMTLLACSSLDVQKGWSSGTAKQMNAKHAQYCYLIRRWSLT